MLLIFGKATVETKGLPRVAAINSYSTGDRTVLHVLLEARTRAAVQKWAKRLGAPVVESDGYSADERQVSAEAESDGNRLRVYTYAPASPADSDPATFPWRVYAQSEDRARWLVNAFATRERADRFAQRHPTQYGPLSIEDATAPAAEAVLHWPSPGLRITTWCQGEPLTAESFATSKPDVTCPACRALLADTGGGAQ
jgi:hypothetical protein